MAFTPDASLFPAAPVADAVTSFGAGEPHSWPGAPSSCPEWRLGPSGLWTAFGRDWHTIRHDWTDGGVEKSWIISENTIGFTDLAEYDNYVSGFRYDVTNCGWTFDRFATSAPYNSMLIELDGLPSDAFAFAIDVYPGEDRSAPVGIEPSSPDAFHALGAVLPGRQRGQLMVVTWIGWGTDVPPDDFVRTANTLFDAAVNAPNKTDPGETELSSPRALGVAQLDLRRSGVLDTIDGTVEDDPPDLLSSDRCNIEAITDDSYGANAPPFTDREAVDSVDRNVTFATGQWRSRTTYLDAVGLMDKKLGRPCVDSRQHQSLIIEPLAVPGLPDGTIVSAWHPEAASSPVPIDGAINVAVVTDDAHQAMMVVAWTEVDGPVPTETFVKVVNQAWRDFIGSEG